MFWADAPYYDYQLRKARRKFDHQLSCPLGTTRIEIENCGAGGGGGV